MKNKEKLFSAALILFFILVSSTASASTAQSTPLTITETQLTTSGRGAQPAIYGDRIVWTDGRNYNGEYDIYMYNISSIKETKITTSGSAYTPEIYGDRIVWTGDSIFMYNLSTSQETRITPSGSVCLPAIYGDKIVWMYDSNQNGKYDIYMYDLSTSKETQITTSENAYNPEICGDKIVWHSERLIYDGDIYIYDLSTSKETQITTAALANLPAIFGDRIVYQEKDSIGTDIFMYNLSTSQETQISHSGHGFQPDIYNDKIVWSDSRTGNSYIYMYDLSTSTETKIGTSGSAANPRIYNNNIVWESDPYDKSDIYMCTISGGELEPIFPVANFTANVTEGSAPLDVQFTNLSTNATDLQWNFGDGSSNTSVANPEHVFTSTGSFNVVLTASNINGSDSKSMAINVHKVTPTITWSNPVDIAYGTKLSIKQLNAKASVPGTFVYTPPAGTVLPVGAQTLKVVFTPQDTTKYTTATQTVTINVVTVPVAKFSASPTTGKAPLPVTFTDLSTGSPSTWTWKFGDGGSLTSKIPNIPMHTYTKKGKYSVSLTVKNTAGSSTKTMSNYITVK